MKTMTELVEALRQEIGVSDDTQDEWLLARAESALAAMRRYCRRWLWPASQFRDAFIYDFAQQCNRCIGRAATLAEIPVVEILSVVADGTPLPADEFEALTTGRLFRKLDTAGLMPVIAGAQLLVDYVAGYEDLPADLYEVIAGVVKKAWGSTEAGAGDALGNVEKLTVFDVGSVELSGAGAFYESSVKAPAAGPILGPWGAQLDSYRDLSRGAGLPAGRDSRYVGAAPTPPPPPP